MKMNCRFILVTDVSLLIKEPVELDFLFELNSPKVIKFAPPVFCQLSM